MNTSSVLATIFKSAAIFNVTHYKNIQKMRENRVYEIKNTETHRTELSRQKHLRRRTPGSRLEQKQANYTSTSDYFNPLQQNKTCPFHDFKSTGNQLLQ